MTGRTISSYEILEKLGEGGMGVVFRARDTRLNRVVALKFLPPRLVATDLQAARFEQEARAIAALSHPHIATLHDIREDGGERFLVLEFLAGGTLKSKLRAVRQAGQRLPLRDVIRYAAELAEALGHAHRRGIVHRDVKSENVMFTAEGVLKLTDFGLAKLSGSADLTQTGYTVGTAAYMSPEQAQGANVDHRSDVFSCGIVLFEMATGELPFRGGNGVATLFEIVHSPAPALGPLRPDAPVRLGEIVARALEKNRDLRYASAEDLAADLRQLLRELESDASPSRSGTRRAPVAVAVLPFANLPADPENEYFSDGLTEDLISALSQIEGLRVVARTSAFQFKGKARDIREVGRLLNAGFTVEGSVRRAGHKVRITAQLVNAADGFQLWSERYDRELRDVFAIQDEICAAIVQALRVRLLGGEERPLVRKYTDNLEAYQHLLKGRYYWNKWTEEGFRRGMEHYSKAISADPAYAPAYAGLSDCFCLLGFWGLAPAHDVMPQAKALALKAVELDGNLADAHASLGSVLTLYDWDWTAGERAFRRALELNPGHAQARLIYGIAHLTPLGRWDEGIAQVRRAAELDPLSLVTNTYLGSALWIAGRSEEAIRQYRRTLDLDRTFGEAWRCLGWACLPGRVDEAIEAFERARELSSTPFVLADLGYALALAGRTREAQGLLQELQDLSRTAAVSPYALAQLHAALGDRDACFACLEQAYAQRSSWLMWVKCGPWLRALAPDPRLDDLVRRVFGSA